MSNNILTVDVEDWFHILDFENTRDPGSWTQYEARIELNLKKILKICQISQTKGTFFILGWVAQRYPELVKLIKEQPQAWG